MELCYFAAIRFAGRVLKSSLGRIISMNGLASRRIGEPTRRARGTCGSAVTEMIHRAASRNKLTIAFTFHNG